MGTILLTDTKYKHSLTLMFIASGLAVLILVCAWKWQTRTQPFYSGRVPIRVSLYNSNGKPYYGVYLLHTEVVSCVHSRCFGLDDSVVRRSGRNGTIDSNVPFPGTFVLSFGTDANNKIIKRKVTIVRPNQQVKLTL